MVLVCTVALRNSLKRLLIKSAFVFPPAELSQLREVGQRSMTGTIDGNRVLKGKTLGFQNETFNALEKLRFRTPFWISKGKFQTLTRVCWTINAAKEREVYILTAAQHKMTKLKWNKMGSQVSSLY